MKISDFFMFYHILKDFEINLKVSNHLNIIKFVSERVLKIEENVYGSWESGLLAVQEVEFYKKYNIEKNDIIRAVFEGEK